MIAIVKNVKSEGPGSIENFLKKNKLLYKVFEAEDGIIPSTLEDYTGLIIMGGPMGVYEMDIYPHLKIVSRLIREAINRDLKVLGICLGSQLIANTLGAKVYKGQGQEIGWQDIELTGDGLRDPLMIALAKHPSVGDVWKKFRVFHWHWDTFDLPYGCTHLAKSELYENQAFKYGEKVYALQFHIEVTRALLINWFNSHSLRSQILNEAEKIIPEYSQRAENFYSAFLEN